MAKTTCLERGGQYGWRLIRLQKTLIRGLDALFVFVAYPEVGPANNRSERSVRREAMVRKGGRPSKSQSGAKHRGVIMTVLATLNTRFEAFTLNQLIDEIGQWASSFSSSPSSR